LKSENKAAMGFQPMVTKSMAAMLIAVAALPLLAAGRVMAASSSAPASPGRTATFAPAPGPLDNPLKGWCTYTTAGPIHQPYSLVYRYISWKELEPKEGTYAFDTWEKKTWDGDPLAKGKHIVFRVFIDFPGQASGIPDWLLAKGLKTRHYTDYGGGESPDYDDPRLVAGLERLIAALGARYDHNPRVAFVALGLLGYWGEWHTYPHTDWFASRATQKRVVDAYHRAFPDKILAGRYPADALGTQPWLGYHDDMIPSDSDGPEDWKFLPMMRRSHRMENWQVAAIGGEMEPRAATRWLGPDYATTRAAIENMHLTWIGPYSPAIESNATPAFLATSQEMVRHMGYQYCLQRLSVRPVARAGARLPITLTGENQGVAPFYYPWPVRLALLDRNGKPAQTIDTPADIRKWLPGSFQLRAALPVHVPPGKYRLALGIIDPWQNRPAIAFANALPQVNGWTTLTTIEVTK